MNALSRWALLLAAALAWAGALGAAEPLKELAAAAGLEAIDAQALKKGEVISARGTKGSFAHGVYVESCFFVRKPMAAVGSALLQWDPASHPADEVAAYQLFRDPAAADFAKVARLSKDTKADRWLLEQTAAVKNGKAHALHLSTAEAGMFRAEPGGASAAWERGLRARAEAVAAGGFAAVAPYEAGGVKIVPAAELRGLLGMTPAIAARFADVANPDPAAGGDRWQYAERSLTQSHTSLALGTITAQAGPESWRVMDCTHYTTDTFFMSVDLYQLWPWEGGTLVWQVDYVAAPFRGYTAGLDKVFAGREVLKEANESIQTFREAVEKQ